MPFSKEKPNSMLKSHYKQTNPNERISLNEVKLKIVIGNKSISKTLEPYIDFYPQATPFFLFELSKEELYGISKFLSPGATIKVEFQSGLRHDLTIVKSEKKTSGAHRLILRPMQNPIPVLGNDQTEIQFVDFHLSNFKNVCSTKHDFWQSTTQGNRTNNRRINNLVFEARGWKISIQQLPMKKELIELLKAQGGYILTDVGRIKRTDGSCFTVKEAEEILQNIYYFLSFARGAFISPSLMIGFDTKGKEVWNVWGVGNTEEWRSLFTWQDDFQGDSLCDLYPKFVSKLHDELFKDQIEWVIYWYLLGNRSKNHDGSIIHSQVALELLSNIYNSRGLFSPSNNKFKDLSACNKIRFLLKKIRISLEVPNELTDLKKYAAEYSCDGPKALTEIRNDLAHSKNRKHRRFTGSLEEAWFLGQWYTELSLLWLLEYQGNYSNRLKELKYNGKTEPVPWKT